MPKFIVVNKNDRNLKPFVIFLPKPPADKHIINYGKKRVNQVFTRVEIPQRLVDLEKKLRKQLEIRESTNSNQKFSKQKLQITMWEYLKGHAKEYEKEIEFIIEEQWKLKHGAWYFIDREPIFINPWYYRYLNYWQLGGGVVPEFRMRDWEYFTVHDYAYRTSEDGNYKDIGNRTVIGVTYPKHRRDGATHKSLCILYSIILERGRFSKGGIQSYNSDNAQEHYLGKLAVSFDNMPFFTKPLWSGSDMPVGGLKFIKPAGVGSVDSLNSEITYATTAYRGAYDGWQLDGILTDESGKTKDEDVLERHEVVVNTVTIGNRRNIFGFMMYPTTVADMEKGGGKRFYDLCKQSQFHERNDIGQTKSGLINYFKAACYGLEGFVDIFGKDVVDDPKESEKWRLKPDVKTGGFVRDSNGKLLGSRRFLITQRKAVVEDISSYNNQLRLFPMEYIECFGGVDGDVGFDTVKLIKRKNELMSMEVDNKAPTVRGYFVWVMPNGTRLTSRDFIDGGYHKMSGITNNAHVEWVDHKEGRFLMSMRPKTPNDRYVNNDGIWFPKNPSQYTSCGDPFQFLKDSEINNVYRDDKSRLSKGGLAVFYERDLNEDPMDKPISEWVSNTFVLSYLYRPPTGEEFGEDSIMAMVYYGGLMFPETNVKDLWHYIVERGFEGYLLYMTDTSGRKLKNNAGFTSLGESKQALFSGVKSYISAHIHREKHLPIVKQFLGIQGLADMTNQDLFVAAAGCLYGSSSRMRDFVSDRNNAETEVDWFEDDFVTYG